MASKNHKRYKTRKINAHHVTPPRFLDPPVFIRGWLDLSKAVSDHYYIEIDEDKGSGHVYPKFMVSDKDYYDHMMYLSTHTFYGSMYAYSTMKLRQFGFNVQLANWDSVM